ncbi:MAG TPA: TIGR02996 domain-containing protein [Kofleriaceae bacterium]|nr:TIGR02996 domain-containing protein [Kofleriaceae bacterium]
MRRFEDLAVTQLHPGGGAIRSIAIAGRLALAAGDRCLATTDGQTFHLRRSPGGTLALAAIDGAIYSCGERFAVTHDRGARWQELRTARGGSRFCVHRDARRTWWMGWDDGIRFSADLDRGWKKATFHAGEVRAIAEIGGTLLFAGVGGGGAWDGTRFRPFAGFRSTDVVTRVAVAPSGALIAIGCAGLARRSIDGGATWAPVDAGVAFDLEDCAWVAGALFVVGGTTGAAAVAPAAVLLRSTDEGQTFTRLPVAIEGKLSCIASWGGGGGGGGGGHGGHGGDGALLGGAQGGLWRLAAPGDAYWQGALDEIASARPVIDPVFVPPAAPPAEEREREYARLFAEAVQSAPAATVEIRAARPPDAHGELARLVDEAPDDDTGAAQVYADWLQAQGDPRGELAAIQLQLAEDPDRADLEQAERALLARHEGRWLGKLAPYQDLMQLVWRAGFLHGARLASTVARSRLHGSKLPPVELEDVLGLLLDEPSARFLRELTVGIVRFEDNTYGGIAAELGKRYLPTLRVLFLGDFARHETELNWSNLGELEPMYAALPNLRALSLRSGHMHLGSIVLPSLERFEVVTGGLDHEAAQAIAAAVWPGLRALSIQIGPARQGDATASADDLQPVLDGTGLPRLAHLGLTNLDFTDALIEPLARGQVLLRLAELDLKMGTLSDDGAGLLYRYQRAFAHLRRIDVDDNYLTLEGVELLAATGLPFHFGEQRDDEGEPEDRYASAYE